MRRRKTNRTPAEAAETATAAAAKAAAAATQAVAAAGVAEQHLDASEAIAHEVLEVVESLRGAAERLETVLSQMKGRRP